MGLSSISRTAARWPPPVLPGARVGVAALSGPVDPQRLDVGLDALRALGFEPVVAANVGRRCGLFAGDDAARLDGFHSLADDPTIEAIVFARGGHGVLRLLPAIDWQRLGRVPRAYVGYSDLTPFLMQVVDRLGLVAFHGPMVAADLARGLDNEEQGSFLQALAGLGPLQLPFEGSTAATPVTGRLIGGCLSLLTATLGTAFAPRLDDALVVIEEVDEPAYRLDRMLTHLVLSGTLNDARGLVMGHLTRHRDGVPLAECWQPVLAELSSLADLPACWGLRVGHAAPNWTIPLGASARLDPGSRCLEINMPSSLSRGQNA